MLKNYLKIAFRNLFKNKVHSIINITGLALGMAAATLLLLNIQFGLSIDQFHKKKDNIYAAYTKGIVNGQTSCWNSVAGLFAATLKSYPEIKNTARMIYSYQLLKYEDKKIAANGNFTDPAFLSMFSFPLIEGNETTALKDPNNIVVTQQLAKKLFGDQDPINKILTTPEGHNFTITGVLKDLPDNTQFKFEFLLPWAYLHGDGFWNSWNSQSVNTYVELTPGTHVDVTNQKILDDIKRTNPEPSQTAQSTFLYPLTKTYLENRFENGRPAGGNIDNLKMLGGLAAIILLIACINFMNLSTARSEKRAKEVGIRKVIGAERRSLIFQFIGESTLLAFIAGMIALILVQIAIPQFNILIKTKIFLPWNIPLFWFAALVFIFFTGILAGSYPAFYLSSFKPVKVLKGLLSNGNALVTPRKILVVVQFVFSIFLINFTVIYQKQIQYELNREVGYAKENLVYQTMTPDLIRNYAAVKNELLNTGTASSVSESNTTVTQVAGVESGLKWEGMDPKDNVGFVLMFEDEGLVRTNGLSLVAGRDIDIKKYPDDTLSCVINETSVMALGFKNPIGRIIQDEDQRWKIVGVVKDFLVGNPDQPSLPLLIKGSVSAGVINISIQKDQAFAKNIQQTEAILKKYNPSYITSLRFADKDYAAKFEQAKNVSQLINTFTFIAIFVSCMGLLGLATYTTENRTREIGIRRVLGSSITGIVSLLAKDFVKLILISVLIASPLAWLFMNYFLQQVSYRTTASIWVLIISGGGALLMALITISFQIIRAALQNPVHNLRTD